MNNIDKHIKQVRESKKNVLNRVGESMESLDDPLFSISLGDLTIYDIIDYKPQSKYNTERVNAICDFIREETLRINSKQKPAFNLDFKKRLRENYLSNNNGCEIIVQLFREAVLGEIISKKQLLDRISKLIEEKGIEAKAQYKKDKKGTIFKKYKPLLMRLPLMKLYLILINNNIKPIFADKIDIVKIIIDKVPLDKIPSEIKRVEFVYISKKEIKKIYQEFSVEDLCLKLGRNPELNFDSKSKLIKELIDEFY